MAHAEEKRILGILRRSPVLAEASAEALARLGGCPAAKLPAAPGCIPAG